MEFMLKAVEIAYLVVLIAVLIRISNQLGGQSETPIEAVKKVFPKKRRRMTAEEKKRQHDFEVSMALMRNVDIFDGTPNGQEEIK